MRSAVKSPELDRVCAWAEQQGVDRLMLLDVRDLSVVYRDGESIVRALQGVTFSVERGESVGLIGESGCGKSTLVRAMLRLLPENARYLSGAIVFEGRDLLTLSNAELRRIRGKRIAMMPQGSMNSLNPVLSVGQQLSEAIRVHEPVRRRAALERAAALLETVGLSPSRLRSFPHELSGGSKQRVCLAMSIALSPDVLIADEPTTALDVVIQRHILNEMRRIRRRFGMSMLLVSHDVSVVAENCDRVLVMYGGRIVEIGATRAILDSPYHPYTMGLRNAFPRLDGLRKAISIPGQPPDLRDAPTGCVFSSRCPMTSARCESAPPPLQEMEPGHMAACWLREQAAAFRLLAGDIRTWMQEDVSRRGGGHVSMAGEPRGLLLQMRDVKKHYAVRRGLFEELLGRRGNVLKAVEGVGLTVREGEILGIAGESGCGKTVTGEMLVGLQRPTSGAVCYRGQDIFALRGMAWRAFRRQAQMIFQDPYETLNPRFTVHRTLADPLDIHGLRRGFDRRRYLIDVLEECGLRPGARYLDRYPFLLSGGERQRVAVARALVLEPTYLVADEPTSMLDVSIRAGVLDLLRSLNQKRHLTVVFISHDLAAMRELTDRIAVMYLGRVIEIGPSELLLRDPLHPYTRGLIAALPRIEGRGDDTGYELRGEIPDATAVPRGCPFAPRCEFRDAACETEPGLRGLGEGRSVACHRVSVDGRPWTAVRATPQRPEEAREAGNDWLRARSSLALSTLPG